MTTETLTVIVQRKPNTIKVWGFVQDAVLGFNPRDGREVSHLLGGDARVLDECFCQGLIESLQTCPFSSNRVKRFTDPG